MNLNLIPFVFVPVTPLPDVWESDSEFAWLEWDLSIGELEFHSPDARAMRLAMQGVA